MTHFMGLSSKLDFRSIEGKGGQSKKKGSIKACEFDCCIKITRDRQLVCSCTNLSIRLKAALLMIDSKNENFKFSKINIMRV